MTQRLHIVLTRRALVKNELRWFRDCVVYGTHVPYGLGSEVLNQDLTFCDTRISDLSENVVMPAVGDILAETPDGQTNLL